jgi:hypothetical protein
VQIPDGPRQHREPFFQRSQGCCDVSVQHEG